MPWPKYKPFRDETGNGIIHSLYQLAIYIGELHREELSVSVFNYRKKELISLPVWKAKKLVFINPDQFSFIAVL